MEYCSRLFAFPPECAAVLCFADTFQRLLLPFCVSSYCLLVFLVQRNNEKKIMLVSYARNKAGA